MRQCPRRMRHEASAGTRYSSACPAGACRCHSYDNLPFLLLCATVCCATRPFPVNACPPHNAWPLILNVPSEPPSAALCHIPVTHSLTAGLQKVPAWRRNVGGRLAVCTAQAELHARRCRQQLGCAPLLS